MGLRAEGTSSWYRDAALGPGELWKHLHCPECQRLAEKHQVLQKEKSHTRMLVSGFMLLSSHFVPGMRRYSFY